MNHKAVRGHTVRFPQQIDMLYEARLTLIRRNTFPLTQTRLTLIHRPDETT
jgi:hypothetical protein